MQFNPKIGFILGILVTIEIAVAGGTLSLTNAIPAAWIPTVQAWAAILASIGSAALTILHGYSNGQTGPLVPDASFDKTVKAVDTAVKDLGSLKSQAQQGTLAQPPKVAVMLAIGLTLSLSLLGGGSAQAQTPPSRPFVPTGNLARDIAATRGAAQAQSNETTIDIVDKIQKLSLPDFQYALAMSKATKNVISTPCWQSWVDLISAQQKPLLDDSGATLVEPDPHIITSIERLSELLAILRPDSTVTTNCAALAGAAGKDVATLVGGILSGGALGLFKLPIVP